MKINHNVTDTAKGSVIMLKPIKSSANVILTAIMATLLDMLAQTPGDYGKNRLNIAYV